MEKSGNSRLCSWYYINNEKDSIENYYIDLFCKIYRHPNFKNILILNRLDVIKWIHKDLSFLEIQNKYFEDEWGLNVMKQFPNFKGKKQWTSLFGEYIAKDIYTLIGFKYTKPIKYKNFQLDGEIEKFIIEVKTGSYFTSGTAHEKILGTPYKYCEIPSHFNKPLKILCIGELELYGVKQYLFNTHQINTDDYRKYFHSIFKILDIEYIRLTTLLYEFYIRN